MGGKMGWRRSVGGNEMIIGRLRALRMGYLWRSGHWSWVENANQKLSRNTDLYFTLSQGTSSFHIPHLLVSKMIMFYLVRVI